MQIVDIILCISSKGKFKLKHTAHVHTGINTLISNAYSFVFQKKHKTKTLNSVIYFL